MKRITLLFLWAKNSIEKTFRSYAALCVQGLRNEEFV